MENFFHAVENAAWRGARGVVGCAAFNFQKRTEPNVAKEQKIESAERGHALGDIRNIGIVAHIDRKSVV